MLLHADGVTGECFNCYDRYVSEYDVAELAKEFSGSDAELHGAPRQPKHQIETGKLRALGIEFGGEASLRETIRELVSHV